MSKPNFRFLCASVAFVSVFTLANISSLKCFASPQSASPAQSGPPIFAVNDPRNYLHLTAAQQEKIAYYVSYTASQENVIAHNASLTNDQKRAKFMAVVASTKAAIKAMLTPAQDAINKQREDAAQATAMKFRQGIMDLNKKAQAVNSQLNASLTPAQKQAVTGYRASAQKQFTALQQNTALSNDQKQQQARTLAVTYSQELNSLWTPKQLGFINQLKQYQEEAIALQRLAMSPQQ